MLGQANGWRKQHGPRIVVVPPSAEAGEIAREMAPAGFELVLARDGSPELEAALGPAEYMVCYPNVTMHDAFYRAAPRLKLVQLLSAGYDAVDLEAARRAKVPVSNNGGANAISVAEHAIMLMLDGVAQGGLAARQRGGRPLARQRPRAAHVRAARQDARHRRPRHHRQEGGAAGAGLRHAGAVLRHRAPERGRRGRTRRALPPAARAAARPPTSSRCTCRSTRPPAP